MRHALPLAFFSLAVLLTGCTSGLPTLVTPKTSASGISGSVHGGNQPVSGATIQIYAPGTTGYGSAATPLITGSPLLTAADGSFNFGNRGLACPSGPTGHDRLYLTATGGNPGFGGTVNNDALFLMTVIDNCQALTASSFFSISEVSTVASIYALAQFMNPTTGNIGGYGYATTGLNNAFDLAVTLFNPATGTAYDSTTNNSVITFVPQTKIDTLANIITPCVNSNGSTSASCAALFPLTTNTTPSNTGLAVLQMALHPGTNVGSLYTLASANAPFQPALTSQPNDLTVAVNYHSGASVIGGFAIDGFGNIWVSDYSSGGSASRLRKFSPTMAPLGASQAGAINNAGPIAIDSRNNVWALDSTDNLIAEFSNSLSPVASTNATSSGANGQAIAVDAGDNPWVADTGTQITEYNVINSSSVAFTGSLSNPQAIAFDNSGNAWVANYGGNSLVELYPSGIALPSSPYLHGGLNSPNNLAIDSTGNVYVVNYTVSNLSEFNSSGVPVATNGYPSSGGPNNIAIDGGGHVWNASGGQGTLTEFYAGAYVSPTGGYQSPGLYTVYNVAIDPSGNVWAADRTHILLNGTTYVNVTNFVGLGTPAITPLAAAVHNGQVGTAAGTPIPVAVTNATLPFYTSGSPYTAQLVASGGTGSYAWTSSTLPTGLSLSSSGLISGTPTGAATTVNFTVTDTALASNTATRSIALSPTPTLPPGANDGNLNGQFAVLIKGFKGTSVSTTGGVNGFAAIGSLIFNGVGGVSGQIDYNGADGTSILQTVTGTYNVGADLRGTLLLNSAAGGLMPHQFAFSVANSYSTLYLTEFDATGTATSGLSSGIGKLQTITDFSAATIQQNFVFGLDGETPCATCAGTVSPYGTLSAAGRIANDVATVTGIQDSAALNTSYAEVGITGVHTTPDANYGRGTMTLAYTGANLPAAPLGYVFYVVNANELLLMSTDLHATSSLLSGDALVQNVAFSSTPASNQGFLTGKHLIEMTSAENGDGVSIYPNLTANFIVEATSTGAGTATVVQDENQAGLITTESTLGTIPYSIDANGRLTLTGAPLAIFLTDSSAGFGTLQPSSGNQGSPGLLVFEQQNTAIGCANLTTPFSFGSKSPTTVQSLSSGVITFTSGVGAATIDSNDRSGSLTSGASNTFTCTGDGDTVSLGRLGFTDANGNPSAGYVVSPTKIVLLGTRANDTKSGMTIVTAQ